LIYDRLIRSRSVRDFLDLIVIPRPCLPTDCYVVRPLATRLRSRTRVLQPNSPEAQRQSDRWRLAETISAVAVATRRPLRTPARWPIEQSPPRQLPHRSSGHGGDRASKRLAPHRIPTAKSRDCFCFTRTLYLFGLVWKPKSLQGSPSIPGVGSPCEIFPREAHHVLLEALWVGFF